MVNYDEYGPEKIFEVYNPKVGMRGFVVIDNMALGVAKGGIRMTPTVNVDEVSRLARAMTWKNSLADLPFGGGKSGIVADPRTISQEQKKEIIQAFAEAIKPICPSLYVAGPDINTTETEMGWFTEIAGKNSCTGKPKKMGGLPHELGSTGFGVAHATFVAVEHLGWDLSKKTVAIEGFGNVGWFAAKFLTERGARLVAVSDSRGVAYQPKGLDFEKLAAIKKEQKTVTAYPGVKVLPDHEILGVDADVLITAAIPDLIGPNDIDRIKAKLIVEGSNIPTTPEVEALLARKGVLVVPDFVANAGGVISSYVEYTGGDEKKMFKMVEEKIVRNTKNVLETAKKEKVLPREAAARIAKRRVWEYCKTCRVDVNGK